jgi:RING finger protein 113A
MEDTFKKRTSKQSKRKRTEEPATEDQPIYTSSLLKNPKKLTKFTLETQQKETIDALGPSFSTSGTAASLYQNSATRTLDVDGMDDLERIAPEKQTQGDYKGLSAYKEYVNERKVNPNQQSAGGLRAGPLKGQSNVRITTRFDYAAGICKDYKETGYCGFGDNCVFMHDRSDYKQGWQLEQEWEQEQLQNQQAENYEIVDEEVVEESDDELPFCCFICRDGFSKPVVTKCMHYFCEKCALKQFIKSVKCFVCGADTKGIFNHAKDLVVKIEKRDQDMKERELLLAQTEKDEGGLDEDGI